MLSQTDRQTGYPSIDKPWLKYYSDEAIHVSLPKCTMYQYIWENNKNNLSDIAIRYYGSKITYGKLFEEIERAASAFSALGILAGDIVTIMSMQTPETIIAIYALNRIGAVANLVYMTLSEKEIVETLHNTNSKALLVLDAALGMINKIKDELNVPVIVLGVADSMPLYLKMGYHLKVKAVKHVFLTWKILLEKTTNEHFASTDMDAPALIVYTSGTTGNPKGVLLSGNRLNAIAQQLKTSYGDKKRQETVLMILPPFIAFGISMIHRALGTGMDMTLWIEMDSDKIGRAFGKLKPNRFVSGPLLIEGIMRHTTGDLSGVYDITGGGEAITPDLEDKFNDFLKKHNSKAQYMTGYGMSEFGSVITLNWLHAYKKRSIGIPLPLTRIRIVEPDTDKELSYGETGEITVSTPCAMLKYYNNEAATEEITFTDKEGIVWIRTGDLGYIDSDGFVFLMGRIKRIYTVLDKNDVACKLFPQRIEELFSTCEFVEKCAVIVKPDSKRRFVPIVFVTLNIAKKDSALSVLHNIAEQELPDHMQPAGIITLSSMPKTQSGKIDYRALETMAEESIT